MSVTHFRACHLCEAICGLAIETDGERILSIKGDPEDSFSRGHICPKAIALQDIQDDPQRLRQPVKRVGERWESIGWEEAFELVASRFAENASTAITRSVFTWVIPTYTTMAQ